jgi:hypothetical protein
MITIITAGFYIYLLIGTVYYWLTFDQQEEDEVDAKVVEAMIKQGIQPYNRTLRDIGATILCILCWPYIMF